MRSEVQVLLDPPLPALRRCGSTQCNRVWGVSSAGRAPALQAGGHRFDPDTLHQSAFLAKPKASNANTRRSDNAAGDWRSQTLRAPRSPGNADLIFKSVTTDLHIQSDDLVGSFGIHRLTSFREQYTRRRFVCFGFRSSDLKSAACPVRDNRLINPDQGFLRGVAKQPASAAGRVKHVKLQSFQV